MIRIFLPLFLLQSAFAIAQDKKPLTHDVYDNWKSVGERLISNDGNFIVYAITPQEGDAEMIIQNINTGYRKNIARGYNPVITEDSRYAIIKIKPPYQDTRQAKIKKKKLDEMPKDSLLIVQLGTDSIVKVSRIKSFKTPEKAGGWLAYHLEKPMPDTNAKKRAL
ncbi:MAG: S9 family peptidase, partial [Gloeobacteraceae cyanobacterium ES-bin-316]|nr:S9 family peptidase [Ferruginibacter sp.]